MNKKKKILIAVLIVVLTALTVGEVFIVINAIKTGIADKKTITEVQYLNSVTQEINSQIKLGGNSSIEWNYRQLKEFETFDSDLGMLTLLSYPRIKKLSNGDLVMTFQEGQVSNDVYMARSKDDGKTWSRATILREMREDEEINDAILYATGELLELQNGDLLYTCSFRATAGYRANVGDGIEVMISKDKGYTWSEPQVVYNGANWEPSMIQLPSGEIQLYFTQQAPYFEKGMFNSVDVGLIRSYDNGKTWTGPLEGEQFRVETLSRHEHADSDGLKSCDGMAVAVVLNEGKGIVYACESVESAPQKISIVYTDMEHNWVYSDFTPDQYGPEGRRWYASGNMRGFAPYLIQAISGETILSFNTDGSMVKGMQVGVGDEEAKNFSGFASPFSQTQGSYWGSLCFKNSHTIIATAMLETGESDFGGEPYKSIMYSEGQLNHTIEAKKQTLEIDGRNKDWLDDSVLFVGSDSQAQATTRFAYDDEYLYILVERLDDYIITNTDLAAENDSLEIMINTGAADKSGFDEDIYKINLSLLGLTGCYRGTANGSFERIDIEGAQTAHRIFGTVNNDADTDTGYTVEAKIPWSALGGKPENGRITVTTALYNDDGAEVIKDTMTDYNPKNWISIVFD